MIYMLQCFFGKSNYNEAYQKLICGGQERKRLREYEGNLYYTNAPFVFLILGWENATPEQLARVKEMDAALEKFGKKILDDSFNVTNDIRYVAGAYGTAFEK